MGRAPTQWTSVYAKSSVHFSILCKTVKSETATYLALKLISALVRNGVVVVYTVVTLHYRVLLIGLNYYFNINYNKTNKYKIEGLDATADSAKSSC